MNTINTATINTDSGVIRRMDDLHRICLTKAICAKADFHEGDPIEIFNGEDVNGEPVIILRQYVPANEFLNTKVGKDVLNAMRFSLLDGSEHALTIADAEGKVIRTVGPADVQEEQIRQTIEDFKKLAFSAYSFQNASVVACRYGGEVIAYFILTGKNCAEEKNLAKLEMAANMFAAFFGSRMEA